MNLINEESNLRKYSYSCPWCHTRISSYEPSNPSDALLICPECQECFHLEINYLTGEIITTKIDTLMSFQA